MKWESWFKCTEYFSSKWLLKEQLGFQSYYIFFAKCTGPTIIQLNKIKGKAETILLEVENCRILGKQLEDGKDNCKAALEKVTEIILQEKQQNKIVQMLSNPLPSTPASTLGQQLHFCS